MACNMGSDTGPILVIKAISKSRLGAWAAAVVAARQIAAQLAPETLLCIGLTQYTVINTTLAHHIFLNVGLMFVSCFLPATAGSWSILYGLPVLNI
jgi:hypothetical protein